MKLIHFALSLLSSHVKLAEVCNKSGKRKCLKKKSNSFSTKAIMVGFFSFFFSANEELIFVLWRKLLTYLSRPILSPGTGGTEM